MRSAKLDLSCAHKRPWRSIRSFSLMNDNVASPFSADQLNAYFTTSATSTMVYLTHLTFLIILFLQSDFSSFFSVDVTVSKGSINSHAIGLDAILLVFIKLLLPLILLVLTVLTQLFNFILLSFIIPPCLADFQCRPNSKR
jgi:hypothetical protein